MELKNLMSGIGVVIDDALNSTVTDENTEDDDGDLISQIVERLDREWNLPLYTANAMPREETWPNLLQAASFILLDWKLWPSGASQLERVGVTQNIRFLEQAKGYFVPVFIFTNENPVDVENELPQALYRTESPEKNFVFVHQKIDLLSEDSLDLGVVENWIRQNASVYTLKTWEQALHAAKRELFSSMYARSPDWPRVFWNAYEEDGVDPSWSVTHLINDSLRGRMRTNAFEGEILGNRDADVPREDILALIEETSFRRSETLPEDEIRCGDLFRQPRGKFLLNLRPDCDCVPRNGEANDVELYCVEGKRIGDAELHKKHQGGHFDERVWESVAFSIHERRSIRFDFRKLRIEKYAQLKEERIGRLLHPYLTRIQQRYALYLQRQGLPRIPREAIPPEPEAAGPC